MGSHPRGTSVALALLLAMAACAGPSTPSDIGMPVPTPPPFAPPFVPSMRVEGQVVDADSGASVAGTVLAVRFLRVDGQGQWFLSAGQRPGTAVTDHTGRFVLEEIIHGKEWETVELWVTRDGYEPVIATATPASADVVVRMYPTLTIRPGESIEARLFLDTYSTAWDGFVFRRVVIDAPPGEPVQVDLTPLDHPYIGLSTGSAGQDPSDHGLRDRMIVSTGAVWITGLSGSPGRVRLTASRP